MKRDLWTDSLSDSSSPSWPCPECQKAPLRLVPKTLAAEETVASRTTHSDPDWDPDWINVVFVAWLKCADAKCGQMVSVTGHGSPEMFFDPEDGMSWENRYRPRVAVPMPDMFELPPKCPEPVAKEIRAAFRSFWGDAQSSANRLRAALERLLDHVGVKKRTRDKHQKLVELSLHSRIEAFAKGEAILGSHLLALKWLGNSGSHGAEVSQDDLLDAFEVFEHCLAEIISQRSKKVATLSKQIQRKHAPKTRPNAKSAPRKALAQQIPTMAPKAPPSTS